MTVLNKILQCQIAQKFIEYVWSCFMYTNRWTEELNRCCASM
jgi:hypothetical protein